MKTQLQNRSFLYTRRIPFYWWSFYSYAMLKYLPETSFTVITNALEIASTLREYKNIDMYLIGGMVKPSGNMTDTLASELISRFSIDLNFSGGGISLNGISTATPEVAF